MTGPRPVALTAIQHTMTGVGGVRRGAADTLHALAVSQEAIRGTGRPSTSTTPRRARKTAGHWSPAPRRL
jgi:hypothetical protein